ncbi:PQ-loop repeat family protein / transmembrane family protein [Melia azedarach]|uniref:PQ-loop repeat family protein / transmembrane family protein n=1 Tax=Melia azedarach TaxID=155640 RepID=A0ACC1XV78_MELAZ|nr:PQ-loop repeat family protein / transmembrane family protein [Melia azedarach]
MSLAYCVKENKPCVRWIEKYFKDCLCNLKDDFSFGFGLISLVCWGVAEIPQIITNFRTKSSHGVSLAFLLTWVAGDVFNLVGCLLEPATLPTQFYTALLYTISTVVLVLQGIYYDHIRRRWKSRRSKAKQEDEEEKKPLKPESADNYKTAIPIPKASTKAFSSPRREYYYTSARSLAGSGTPPFRSYIRVAQSGPSALGVENDSSSDDEAAPSLSSYKTPYVSQPRPIPKSAGYGTFLAASVNLPMQSKAFAVAVTGIHSSRRLLQENSMEHSAFGQWLGWLMAAIYMGGRLPQIWLNIKRGSVEGLNPLMFVFALVANVTYVLSIVVRTTEWENIKANMAWLLDAVVCVALDLFIIVQYIYYRYFRKKSAGYGEEDDNDHRGDYLDATKLTT